MSSVKYDLNTKNNSKSWNINAYNISSISGDDLQLQAAQNYIVNILSDTSFNSSVDISNRLTVHNQLIIDSSNAIQIPVGTSGERPYPGIKGHIRYNIDSDTFEGYDGNVWGSLGGSSFDSYSDASLGYVDASYLNVRYDSSFNSNLDVSNNLNIGLLTTTNSLYTKTDISVNNNIIIGGELRGPSTFIIDPTTIGDNTGLVVIKGGLQIDGSSTIINSSTLDISDHTILLSSSATHSSQTDGAGIEISGNKTFTYLYSNDVWNSNIGLNVDGDTSLNKNLDICQNLTVSGETTLSSLIVGDLTNNRLVLAGTSGAIQDSQFLTFDGSNLVIDTSKSIQIPVGTTAERPAPSAQGQIRYNITDSTFEGYDGTAWGSLGGVKDTDGDTYISAETSAGADNDQLVFYTVNKVRGMIDSSSNFLFGDTQTEFTIDGCGNVDICGKLQVSHITSISGNDLTIEASGNNKLIFRENDVSYNIANFLGAAITMSSYSFVSPSVCQTNLTLSGDWVDLSSSGYTMNYTPSNSSSSIYVRAKINYINSIETNQLISFRLLRNIQGESTPTILFTDTSLGIVTGINNNDIYTIDYLDTPNTTNQITYYLKYQIQSTSTHMDFSSGVIGYDVSAINFMMAQEILPLGYSAYNATTLDASYRNLDITGTFNLTSLTESAQVKSLYYNTTTGEITYDNSGTDVKLNIYSDASFGYVDISDNLTVSGTIITNGSITGGSFVIGSANISEAELETIDGITAGTVSASKAVVVDSNKDVSGFRNITSTGVLDVGNSDLKHYIGKAAIGYIGSTGQMAGFAHRDHATDTNYALKQGSNGGVFLNAPSTKTIAFSINNVETMNLDNSGIGVTGSITASATIKALDISVNRNLDVSDNLTVSGSIIANGSITGGSFVIGSANISEAELETIDGITAGTAAASKALVVDSSVDISGIRNITTSGTIKITGGIEAGKDTDTTSYFGAAAIGNSGASDQATFAHLDNNSTNNLALKQTAAGRTILNAKSGQNIQFRINNTDVMRIANSGNLGIGLSTTPNHNLEVNNDISASKIYVNDASFTNLTTTGSITGGSFVIGSANISEAELETIDGITAGTVAASKALVVDSNKDIGTIRNLTIDGIFTDGNYTFDTNGNVSGLGTVGCGAITSSGGGNFYNVLESTGGNAFFKSKTSTGEFGIGTSANDFGIYSYDDSEYRMWITDAGNVGFGTTSPQDKLHIYGAGTTRVAVESGGTHAYFKAQSSSRGYGIGTSGTSFRIYDYDAAAVRVSITSAGLVGLGTDTPGAKLDVVGDISATGSITGGSLVIGSANISETELETIDGITAGTAAASKALVLDSNKDIGTIRNLTIDGVFTDGNYTFDTNGNVSGLGTVGCGAITSSGSITGGSFVIGSANISEAELETIDGITAGTAAASKALVLDSNKDIGTIRNLTIDGVLDCSMIEAGKDTNTTSYFGHSAIGTIILPAGNMATFAHTNAFIQTDYAIMQGSNGQTYLNASDGNKIVFRIRNVDEMALTQTGLGIGTINPTKKLEVIGDISCSNTLTSKTIVPPLVAYTVISGNANSLLNDFLYVKNRLCISSHASTVTVTNGGNLGYFPDIYGDSSKLTHSDTGSKQSVGIIDTDIFDLSHCVTGDSVSGGNTSNAYTGANARWGIKVKIGGLYSIKYTVNIENETYGDRASILATPRFTISDSGGTEYYMDLLQARSTEYVRNSTYGQYCCLTGMGTFSIPNASANHANGAWLKINLICGKATSEVFDDHVGGLKVRNMSIKMKRLGDHVGG
jgi:hypothetical protein